MKSPHIRNRQWKVLWLIVCLLAFSAWPTGPLDAGVVMLVSHSPQAVINPMTLEPLTQPEQFQRPPKTRLKDPWEAKAQVLPAPPPQQPKPFQKAVVQVAAFSRNGTLIKTPGSGVLITLEGHLLTNSHVVRAGEGFCAKPPDAGKEGEVAPLIVLLVTEDTPQSPIPRYVADLVTDDPHLDIAALKISHQLKEGLSNLQQLATEVSDSGNRDTFLAKWAQEGSPAVSIEPMILWDSDATLEEQRVIALGYPRPRTQERNPGLNIDRGYIQRKRVQLENTTGEFLRVGAAFATTGSSGGAVVRAEENREYLIGLICAGEFGTGGGTALARPVNSALDGPIKQAGLQVNQAPVADFIAQPAQPQPLETVVFDASQGTARGGSRDRDGFIERCHWEFAFKEAGEERSIPQEGCRTERSFPRDSKPIVTLTVEDNNGLTDSFSQELLLNSEGKPCLSKLFNAAGDVKQLFDSIQHAIEQASDSELIEILPPMPPLVCSESIEIRSKKALTLRGAHALRDANAYKLEGDGEKPTVLIADSEDISLEGLTIAHGNPGVRVENSRTIRFKNSIFTANRSRGIQWVSAYGRISDSLLQDNIVDVDGLFGQGLLTEHQSKVDVLDSAILRNPSAGVAITEESEVTILHSRIEGNADHGVTIRDAILEIRENSDISSNLGVGIVIQGSARATIEGSRISNNEESGIRSVGSAQLDIVGNTISSNKSDGMNITVRDSGQATIRGNNSVANDGAGISVSTSDDGDQVLIEENEISDNANGLKVGGVGQIIIRDNTVSGSKAAISLLDFRSGGDGILVTVWHSDPFSPLPPPIKATIERNIISRNEGYGIAVSVSGESGCGSFWLPGPCPSADVTIKDNEIFENYIGVYIAALAIVQGNVLHNNRRCGVDVSPLASINGADNSLQDNGADLCPNAPSRLRVPLAEETGQMEAHVPEDYGNIQMAIDAVATGGTVTVASGHYVGGLTIYKPLTLRGTGPEQVILMNRTFEGPVISITSEAKGVLLEGLSISGKEGILTAGGEGILIGGLAQATIQDSQVSAFGYGIYATDQAEVTIQRNTIRGKVLRIGILTNRPHQAAGVYITASAKAEIRDNTIKDVEALSFGFFGPMRAGYGIYVGGSAQVNSKNNEIFNNDYGIAISADKEAYVTIDSNRIHDNRLDGLSLWGSAVVSLTNSTISSNGDDGLSVGSSSTLTIMNSTISGNSWGLIVWDSATINLIDSTISGNSLNGIEMDDSANATIQDSHILDNRRCGILVDSKQVQIKGAPNEMRSNGADLCGFAPSSIRQPLASQTLRTRLAVPDDFQNVQEAIDAIAPGGTITIASSNYEAELTIWKPLTLQGEGRDETLLQASWVRSLGISITAEAQTASIKDLTVSGSGGSGIWVYSHATLEDARVSNHGLDGLYLDESAQLLLKSVQIAGNWRNGLLLKGSAQIEKTRISANKNGIYAWGTAQLTLQNSALVGNEYGLVFVAYSGSADIANNKILRNEVLGISALGEDCGKKEGAQTLQGSVSGQDNEVELSYNGNGHLCPPYPGPPWPEGFVKKVTTQIPVKPGVLDHAMAKDVMSSAPNDPIERTNTFSAEDEKAVSWIRFGRLYRAHIITWKLYQPDGKLFDTLRLELHDPQSEGYEWWNWYAAWCSLYIKGFKAATLLGLWKVEILVDGVPLLLEAFTIGAPKEPIEPQGKTGINAGGSGE